MGVLTRGGATWWYNPPAAQSDAELIPEIPKAMRQELHVQGIVNLALLGLVFTAIQLIAKVTVDSQGAVNLGGIDLIFAAIVGGCGMLVFGPTAHSSPLRRQLRFRRQHGKWRWEG